MLILFILVIILLLIVFFLFCILPFETPFDTIWGNSIWTLNRKSNFVALTFDDGPNPPYTNQILNILKEKNVKATFFIIGENLNKNSCEIIKRMHEEGHSIGNHSYTHSRLFPWKFNKIEKDIEKVEAKIKECIPGIKINIFRSKSGWRSPFLYWVLRNKDYFYVGWSPWGWGYDWIKRSPEKISRSILSHVKGGSIIVLHDGKDTHGGDRSATRDAIPLIIDGVREKGLEFVTIDVLIHHKR